MKQSQVQEREIDRLHLLLGTVMVGIVLSVLLEGIIQLLPPHYNPLSQSESDLAVGPYGWLMALNFVMRGLLYLMFLAALMRAIPKEALSRSGLILVGVSAIGKFVIACAATDLTERPETIHGTIHAIAALVSFFCGAYGALLLSRSVRHVPNVYPSQRFLVGLATVTLAWSVIVILTVFVSTQIGVWGLFERILTALFFLWIFLISLGLWRSTSLEGTPVQSPFPYSPGRS